MNKINLSFLLSSLFFSNIYATDLSKPENIKGYTVSKELKVSGELRARYEFFDDGNSKTKSANATTNRLYLMASWNPISNMNIYSSFININDLGNENYSYKKSSTQKYAYINDKYNTIMPEAYLRYNFKNADTIISVGNQKLSFNNSRHIGIENWRHGFRTYKSLYLKNNTLENLDVELAYSLKSNYPHIKNDFLAINANLKAFNETPEELYLKFYDFMIDNLSDSLGIIAGGYLNFSNIKLNLRGEYSHQIKPVFGNSSLPSSNYLSLYSSLELDSFNIHALYSVQEQNYLTPFASKHNFNGHLDMDFTSSNLNTINLGYMQSIGNYGEFNSDLYFFSQNSTGSNLGIEFDVSYKHSLAKNLNILGEVDLFSANNNSVNDNTKAWLQVDYSF